MFKNKFIISTVIGGVVGAAGVYFLISEQGIKTRAEFLSKFQSVEGAKVMQLLADISKDWTEFSDVLKIQTNSTKNSNG
ncbi:YtxH domain-containing protein [Halalkalibacter akibai]|uniref:YtxH domain-containing protein n=1 Tax=Halalkalibacter akibai (strain ATCC 43226 / DSM 21942 / CIP 109018 / JCM 9157 / 1139) TaxID=1236973 RepID=W4QNS0_HALA3|nr:YtxH domain-containing protein [Halalkalibacter akibai]GAE33760.1 hypothetical protein JCM9157_785 [Halalkalibacter akibai JCM 9157]